MFPHLLQVGDQPLWNWFSKSKKPEKPTTSGPAHGTIRVEGRKLVVTNPEEGGRFPILAPSSGVIIHIGGEPLEQASPVSDTDDLHWELAAGQEGQPFFRVAVAEDEMTASVEILTDPAWYSDGAVVQPLPGGELTLVPAVVTKSRKRATDPVSAIRTGLQAAGVTFGINEEALLQVVRRAGEGWRGSEVVATGQEAQAPTPDVWEWYNPQGLAAPGQVVAVLHRGIPNLPRTTVSGVQRPMHANVESPHLELGPGIRLLPSNQAVATRRGLLRISEQVDKSLKADVVDAQVIEGDVQPGAVIDAPADLAITGDVQKGAKIKAAGSVLIIGKATDCEVTANTIEVLGRAEGSTLCTVAAGSGGPMAGFLRIFHRQLSELAAGPSDYITPFRRAQGTLRYSSDLLRSLPPFEPGLGELMNNCTRVLMSGPEGSPPERMKELATEMERFFGLREARSLSAGNVELRGGVLRCQVWSGKHIIVEGAGIQSSQLYAIRDIQTGPGCTVGQSELMAARGVAIKGAAAKGRPVTIRAGGKVTIGEAAPGTVVELGGVAYTFKAEMIGVILGLSTRYEMQVRLDK